MERHQGQPPQLLDGATRPWRMPALAGVLRMSLAAQFLAANLVVLVLGMLLLGGWVGREIEGAVLSRTAAITALYVGSAVAPYLQSLDHHPRLDASELAGLDHILTDTPLGERVVEFRVWSNDGTILYSPDRDNVGRQFSIEGGLQRALDGEVDADLSDLDEPEHVQLRQRAPRLLEVYAPLRSGSRVMGAVEFYQLPDELEADIAAAQTRSWAVVAGITIITYLLLAGIVKRGSDTIHRQQHASRQQLVDLRELADDNARLYRQAQAAIGVRDEFLGMASHELKTPVMALLAFTQLMRARLNRGRLRSADEFGPVLDEVHAQAERLGRLGSQLLDSSRIAADKLVLERELIDLAALVREAVQARDAAIHVSAPETLTVLADRLHLERILANLLDNAIKFSPAGGPIEVELAESSAGLARLAVRDHGIGVPVEHRPYIFDRFYQAHAGQHFSGVAGLGLGLYISRRIVELHDGQISAEFPAEGGTRVVVNLPIGVGDVSNAAASTPVAASSAADSLRVSVS